jgi:hypothetical protein
MAETKTKPTIVSVDAFLAAVPDNQRREDALRIRDLMHEITGESPKMWGPSIVGFGEYHYVYDSGHEGDSCLAGFSPRKEALVVYGMGGLQERFGPQIQKLGKCKVSKGCLYIKKLADVDLSILREVIRANVAYLRGQAKPKTAGASATASAKPAKTRAAAKATTKATAKKSTKKR